MEDEIISTHANNPVHRAMVNTELLIRGVFPVQNLTPRIIVPDIFADELAQVRADQALLAAQEERMILQQEEIVRESIRTLYRYKPEDTSSSADNDITEQMTNSIESSRAINFIEKINHINQSVIDAIKFAAEQQKELAITRYENEKLKWNVDFLENIVRPLYQEELSKTRIFSNKDDFIDPDRIHATKQNSLEDSTEAERDDYDRRLDDPVFYINLKLVSIEYDRKTNEILKQIAYQEQKIADITADIKQFSSKIESLLIDATSEIVDQLKTSKVEPKTYYEEITNNLEQFKELKIYIDNQCQKINYLTDQFMLISQRIRINDTKLEQEINDTLDAVQEHINSFFSEIIEHVAVVAQLENIEDLSVADTKDAENSDDSVLDDNIEGTLLSDDSFLKEEQLETTELHGEV